MTQSNSINFVAEDLFGTDRLGRVLGETLPNGTTVALCGTLGAGKTRLVQAIAASQGIPRETVVSPTFVLCQEYYGARTIFHLDAYRLDDQDEFMKLGPDEYFQSAGLTFVEWADRVSDCLPPNRIEIQIEVLEGDKRRFQITGFGEPMQPVVREIERKLADADL
jgi:tRNA threonylcarbamoyladenosine biosynthesis protein TsaE